MTFKAFSFKKLLALLGAVFFVTLLLLPFYQPTRTDALTNDQRNRIVVAALANCLVYEKDGGDSSYTTWTDVLSNDDSVPESTVVGMTIDSSNGIWTCDQVLDEAIPILDNAGLLSSSGNGDRQKLEVTIFGNTLRSYGDEGIDGGTARDLMRDFAANVLQPYMDARPITDEELAERLLVAVTACYFFSDSAITGSEIIATGSGGQQIWGDRTGLNAVEALNVVEGRRNDGFITFTKAEIGDIELGFDVNTGFLGDAAFGYNSDWYPLGQDFHNFATRQNDNSTFGRGFSQENSIIDCDVLKESKVVNDIFPFYALADDGQTLTLASGVTVEEIIDQGEEDIVTESTPTCESEGGAFSFVLCPALGLLDSGVDAVDGAINGLLAVKFEKLTESGSLRNSWSRIRNVAYVILIPVMLVMVIGTALGFSAIDAYTVKRALPRLFLAVIFIALSWDICRLMIEVSNGVGQSIAGLIGGVVRDGGINDLQLKDVFTPAEGAISSYGSFAIIGGVLAGATLTGAILPLLGILGLQLLAVFMSMVVAFMLLALRQMIIFALVIISPVAIISWIFPGNDALWKLWWNTFSKLLLLFPVITLMIVTGKAFAFIIFEAGGADNAGVLSNLIDFTLKFVAYVGPYFLIPAAFRFTGGAFANLAGIANDRSKGLFDRNRQRRQKLKEGMAKDLAHRAKSGKLIRNESLDRRTKANERIQKLAHLNKAAEGGLGGWRLRNVKSNIASGIEGTEKQEREENMKDPELGTWAGNDGVSGVAGDVLNEDDMNLEKAVLRGIKSKKKRELDAQVARGEITETEAAAQLRAHMSSASTIEQARGRAKEIVELQKSGNFEGALRNAFDATDLYEGDAKAVNTTVGHVMRAKRKLGDHVLAQNMVLQAMAGGTYYEDAADTWRAAGKSTHDDKTAEADMVVKGRQALMGAGRAESGGGGFGTTLGTMNAAAKATSVDELRDTATAYIDHVIDQNAASTLIHPSMKDGYIEANVIPTIQKRLEKAVEGGDHDTIMRELATVDNIHQALLQTKPTMAKMFGKSVLDMDINPTTVEIQQEVPRIETRQVDTGVLDSAGNPIMRQEEVRVVDTISVPTDTVENVRQFINSSKGDPRYQNYHKEFYSAEDIEKQRQAGQAAAQAAAQAGAAPPPPVPPVTPGLGG